MPPEFGLVKMSNGELRGFRQDDDKAWKRFKAWWKRLEPGEFFTLSYKRPRNGKVHRKFFAMLNYAFQHWEPARARKRLTYKGLPIEKNFDAFREQVTILAGFYEASYDLKGRVKLKAKSIAYDKMDDDEFVRLYEAVFDVLMKHVFINHTREDLREVIAKLEEFDPT